MFKAKDPDDIVRLISASEVEVDLASGRVSNFDDVVSKVKAFKESKSYLFEDDTHHKGAVLPPSKQAPAPSQEEKHPVASASPLDVWNMSPKQLREYQAARRNSAAH
jgi:hypothetical protein